MALCESNRWQAAMKYPLYETLNTYGREREREREKEREREREGEGEGERDSDIVKPHTLYIHT